MIEDTLKIGGKELSSRLFLGTGKFGSKDDMRTAIQNSKAEVVTVALRRIDLESNDENILSYIPEGTTLMVNTSGARTAKEAIRIAKIAKEAGYGNWVKIEVINDSKYLLPDNLETLKAVEALASDDFVVLPYISPDLYFAREMAKAGAAAIMPLGSLIGSNQGIKSEMMIKILIDELSHIPIVIDAGIGAPSDAAYGMEMGASAILVNTAVATAGNPVLMAEAFANGVKAGRMAYLAKLAGEKKTGSPSSPITGLIFK